jgi:ATP-dependent DNA helicase RecG
VPQFVVKAIRYPGNTIHQTDYLDTEDFAGPLRKIFDDALAFVMRNLHKVQAGRGVNAPGTPEIPELVFEEMLVNALVHRDYLVSAPIRLFIFDDRIEIISPGHLPNNLTVDKIRTGNSNIRNPILVSFVAKGLLPYHGLGSGITRALEAWPRIDFKNDHDGCLFTVTIHRVPLKSSGEKPDTLAVSRKSSGEIPANASASPKNSGESSGKSSGKTEERLLALLRSDPTMTIPELASALGRTTRAIEKQVARLRTEGRLCRIGPTKSGRWQVLK